MSKTIAASSAIVKNENSSHPPTQQMVDTAIKSLNERGGSSFFAIKKYIAANYNVAIEKTSPHIKKYLKAALISGNILQAKGKGFSGSFKLSALAKKEPKVKKKISAEAKAAPKPKVTAKATAKPKSANDIKARTESKSLASLKSAAKAAVKPKAIVNPKSASKRKAGTILKEQPGEKKLGNDVAALTKNTRDNKKVAKNTVKNAKKPSPANKKSTKRKASKGGNGNSHMWCTPEDWKKIRPAKMNQKGKRGGKGNRYIWCKPEEWELKYKHLHRY